MTLCAGMEILAWFLVEGKYYLHTWFLCTTGLLRYQGPPEKWKKAKKKFQRPQTRPQLHLLKFCNFFALCGPFWHKNSADRSNLSLKAIKAKKANIRPNDSKLDFRIFRGLAMVPQHAKRSYKVPWRPIGIRFWETTTPEPKIGPAGQKILFDKKLRKIKVEGSYLMSFFDFHQFFVRWNFLTRGTYFWFWSCRFSKPYPDWPSRHFIRPLSMLGDHC